MKIIFLAPILIMLFHGTLSAEPPCDLSLDEQAERAGYIRLQDNAESNLSTLAKKAKGDAEISSVDFHQSALLKAISVRFLEGYKIAYRTARNIREGIVKSDKGKLAVFKEWWTSASSKDGELMMRSLQLKGKGPLANVLRRLNNGRAFINPKLSLETLRKIFEIKPLQGYFHEFPGMRDAERNLIEKKITFQDFVEQIEAIYAHNGPGDPGFSYKGAKPFWANVPDMIMGEIKTRVQRGELPREALDLFKDTIFEQKDGSYRYPDPVSLSGLLHMVEDRFDGYRDSRKIRDEVRFFPPIVAEVDMMFNTNYEGTRAALVYDRDVLLPRLIKNGTVPENQRRQIESFINNRLGRLEGINGRFKRLVVNSAEILSAIQNKQPIEKIIIRVGASGETREFTATELGDGFSSEAAEFRKFIDGSVRGPIMEGDQGQN